MQAKQLGIAVIGSGRMGRLRASLARTYPTVGFVGVADVSEEAAQALGKDVEANVITTDIDGLIHNPEVNAVVVSTPEGLHRHAAITAMKAGKSVLVEKPIAITLEDADEMIKVSEETGVSLHVGYTRRYKDCFLRTKEQILQGRLGTIMGLHTRVYNGRGQGMAILQRDRHATPVIDILTYYIDLVTWFMPDNPPVSVVARGQTGIFKEAGYDAYDVTWAILTMRDGAVVNMGVSYALPLNYPALGQTDRWEILGSEGTMMLDDDHTDHMLYSEKGIPHAYLKDRTVNFAFLGGHSAGDWALGSFWGGMANETRSWLDHLSLGRSIPSTTPREARQTLEVTLAIEEACHTGKEIRFGNN
jgi:predicted dehydrogenase